MSESESYLGLSWMTGGVGSNDRVLFQAQISIMLSDLTVHEVGGGRPSRFSLVARVVGLIPSSAAAPLFP